jgi:hypothetical protein
MFSKNPDVVAQEIETAWSLANESGRIELVRLCEAIFSAKLATVCSDLHLNTKTRLVLAAMSASTLLRHGASASAHLFRGLN